MFICVCVGYVHMSHVSMEAEESDPRSQSYRQSWAAHHRCWEPITSPLQEQQVLSAAEPILPPSIKYLVLAAKSWGMFGLWCCHSFFSFSLNNRPDPFTRLPRNFSFCKEPSDSLIRPFWALLKPVSFCYLSFVSYGLHAVCSCHNPGSHVLIAPIFALAQHLCSGSASPAVLPHFLHPTLTHFFQPDNEYIWFYFSNKLMANFSSHSSSHLVAILWKVGVSWSILTPCLLSLGILV